MAYLFTFGIASKFHTEFNTENVVQIGSWKNIWKQIVYRVAYLGYLTIYVDQCW